MKTIFLLLALAIVSLSAHAQPLPGYYFELVDFGVKPDRPDSSGGCLRSKPTPMTLTGAKTVTTYDVERMMGEGSAIKPAVIDVENLTPVQRLRLEHDGGSTLEVERESLPDAIWLPGAGSKIAFDDKNPQIKHLLLTVLSELTAYNKMAPLLFVSSGYDCWMSYNVARFAVANGFTNVLWYRGGVKSWLAANHPPSPAQRIDWLPAVYKMSAD